jgi:hypothetical protein
MSDKKVDEDWKRRAQVEKEQDAAKAGDVPSPAAGTRPRGGPEPAASPLFAQLVESLASQALMFMGAIRDPLTGGAHQDLHQAQAMIDMLGMVEEKTRGNLTKDEAEQLRQILDEIRTTFVRLSAPPAPRAPKPGSKPRP